MNKEGYAAIMMILIFACALQYFSNAGTLYPSGSYNFQRILAGKQVLDPDFNLLEYDNIYANNAQSAINSKSVNPMYLSASFIGVQDSTMLSYIFLVMSILSIIILFHKMFSSYGVGIFAAIIFLSNSTFLIVEPYIFYFYMSMFLLISFIENRNILSVALIFPLLLASYFTHTSSFFAIFVILSGTSIIYLILNVFNRNTDKKQMLMTAAIISLIALISLFIVSQTSGTFINDFIKNFPKAIERAMFYVLSYEKSAYFYLYIIEKIILIPLSLVFVYVQLKHLYLNRLDTKDKFVLSFFFSFIPLSVLFGFTNVLARTFDYMLPLLGALTFYELRRCKLSIRIQDTVIISLITLFILSSVIHFTIPPRSLEKYDDAAISGLQFAMQSDNVFTDTFLANVFLSHMDYYTVEGLGYSEMERVNAVYYEQNENVVSDTFRDKNINYFVISKHSLTRGLDILNAPHFLPPLSSVSKYDSMRFLDKVYSNEMIWIWDFRNEN